MDVLKKAESTQEKILNVFAGFGIIYCYISLISLFFRELQIISIPKLANLELVQVFVMAVVIAPLWEELFARVGMLYFTKNLDKSYLVPAMILSSVIFGWLHGSVMNVFFQGAIGFVIACVYVKNGYHYWSAVALHAMWNGFLFVQMLMK